jgi:hypothetical protein
MAATWMAEIVCRRLLVVHGRTVLILMQRKGMFFYKQYGIKDWRAYEPNRTENLPRLIPCYVRAFICHTPRPMVSHRLTRILEGWRTDIN